MKILMVCLGNICRSPMAEAVLQHKALQAGLNWHVESAGTNRYHTGEALHLLSQKVSKLNGIDISNQRARSFCSDDFDNFDLIYALAKDVKDEIRTIALHKFDESKVKLLMNEIIPGKDLDVPDPWYGPEQGYHLVYKMIEEACNSIVNKYTPQPPKGESGFTIT